MSPIDEARIREIVREEMRGQRSATVAEVADIISFARAKAEQIWPQFSQGPSGEGDAHAA